MIHPVEKLPLHQAKSHPEGNPHHKRQTPNVEVIVGPVTKSVTASISSHNDNEHHTRNERIGREEKLEEGQGHQYESLKNLVSNLESKNDALNSNEKWFNRIRRRIKLSNRNVNRRRLVPVKEETYEDDEQDDIVHSVVSNVLQNNRRSLDLSNQESKVVENREEHDLEEIESLDEE